MVSRETDLQAFVDAADIAFHKAAENPASRRSLTNIFSALTHPKTSSDENGNRLPACIHLEQATAHDRFVQPELRNLISAFVNLERRLFWRRRDGNPTASPNFTDNHANAMIVGPSGLEERQDVWLGVTLMAPHTRYPDHDHPPEETYLVMSDGEFSHGGGPWFRPGPGGSFYNEPGIIHAMRSGEEPLLAFWALWPDSET